mmetsp:Transcript_14269/g.20726  ORF Transcript_14269/g.20726 Transcript_14269/m.20726 type:complete len:656 (-) Transcript_14269:223-2190(-)
MDPDAGARPRQGLGHIVSGFPEFSPTGGVRSVRPEWQGWHLPSFTAPSPSGGRMRDTIDDGEDDTPEFEEMPAIEEHEQLLLPADDDWLYEENEGLSSTVGSLPERKEGVLTLWTLVGIMYFASSGGPEGTEGLVASAGPGGALLGIVVAAFLWSAPIALMSAELGTIVPENGGAMVWARAAFGAGSCRGDAIAFCAGWCSFLFTAVDAALYPSMFVSYLVAGTGLHLMPQTILGIKLFFCAALILHNCAGVGAVGESSKVMIVLLLCPFVVFIVTAFSGVASWPFSPEQWTVVPDEPNYGEIVLLLAWNLGMWESAAACAGEVKDPVKTFPRALAIVVLLVVANYVIPILAFTAVEPDWKNYVNGCYVDIARKYGGLGFGAAVALGQCISTTGLFENGLVKNSYTLCGMSEQTLLPRFFQLRWVRTDAPVPAIIFSSLVTGCFVCLSDFSAVLGVDMLLYAGVLTIEIASFVVLRIHCPPELSEEGFRIPLQGILLIPFFAPCLVVCGYIAYVTPYESYLAASIMMCIGFVLYLMVFLFRESKPQGFQQIATAVPELLETPACSRLNTPNPSVQGSVRDAGSFYARSTAGSRLDSEAGSRRGSRAGSVSSVRSQVPSFLGDDDSHHFGQAPHTPNSALRLAQGLGRVLQMREAL